jgi:hypothetical protein
MTRVFSCAGFYNFEECDLANKREKKKKYKDQDQIFYNSALTSCILDCTKLGKKEKRGRNVTCYSTNDTSLLIFPGNFIRSDLQSYFKNPNKQTVPSTISLQFHPFDSRYNLFHLLIGYWENVGRWKKFFYFFP